MHLNDLHLTVGILSNGAIRLLYSGPDATKAAAAYAAAGPEFQEVGVVAHPQALMPRRPAEEAAEAARRAEAAKEQAQAQARAKKAKAAQLAADAKRMAAEAKALEKEAGEDPEK